MQAPSDEVEGPPGPDPAPVGLASWRWNSIALLVFLVAILLAFAEVWRADPRIAVPAGALGDPSAQSVLRADVTLHRFEECPVLKALECFKLSVPGSRQPVPACRLIEFVEAGAERSRQRAVCYGLFPQRLQGLLVNVIAQRVMGIE